MNHQKKIKSALISVFHKEGLEPLVKALIEHDVRIYSTGGTGEYLRSLGAEVHEVADLTDYPSILGGRVKTLHPKVFGGILARRAEEKDLGELMQYGIPEIDLVVVDLYPFEDTVASGAPEQAIIEKIDIGGISLIRAAAKNFADVAIVPSAAQYEKTAAWLHEQGGMLHLEQRKELASDAFQVSAGYDRAISSWFASGNETASTSFNLSVSPSKELRYGENPHQKGWFYGNLDEMFEQLNGKELSYNNLVDIDAAVQLILEFQDEPAFAVLKHTNPCGIATGENIHEAWKKAYESDPLSAFGGILICNGRIEAETANEINEIFIEVLIAPDFSQEALDILSSKKNRIILKAKGLQAPGKLFKSVLNGVIVQETDKKTADQSAFEYKTERKPDSAEIKDIVFGEKVVKHLKSNAIAIVKNGQLIGSGVGQTSRVDALKQAIAKAHERGFDTRGAVLASDAFFPFSDSAEIAFKNKIEIIVEPGGSVRDEDTIDFCRDKNMVLVFTGIRHFKH